jgi:hypothetical protein
LNYEVDASTCQQTNCDLDGPDEVLGTTIKSGTLGTTFRMTCAMTVFAVSGVVNIIDQAEHVSW